MAVCEHAVLILAVFVLNAAVNIVKVDSWIGLGYYGEGGWKLHYFSIIAIVYLGRLERWLASEFRATQAFYEE